MVIRDFGAIHFRNYRELRVTFSGGINLFTGANGQGKTNLAEAIYFLCHLSSFRTPRLEPLLTQGEGTAWIQGTILKDDSASKARVEITRRGRRAWLDEQPIATLSAYAALFYALLFNPDSLYNYRQHPAERRALYDRFLSFVDRAYMEALRDYRAVLLQKNRLLKLGELASLPEWNQLLIQKAYDIMKKRGELMTHLERKLSARFSQLTGRQEPLALAYRPTLSGDPALDAATLDRTREQERQVGHALRGPHRDDFHFTLGPQRAESYFSQGEYRISVLALKLALNDFLEERKGFRPVLILDDVFSELDETVQGRLLEHLAGLPNQIFITTTHVPSALRSRELHTLEIRAGRIA